MKRENRGFTLIELLIVVAVIGIIAAIAIPNLLNAVQRGKQKRTMGDLRTVSTATEAYAVDNASYVVSANYADVSSVQGLLEPTYVERVPTLDGWNSPFQYKCTSVETYTVYSMGRNKAVEGNPDAATPAATRQFNNDIILSAGSFVVYPDGPQN